MHKIFTSEDLIRYAYQEMSSEESLELNAELQYCEELREELTDIEKIQQHLNDSVEQVNPKRVNSILAYSASLRIIKSSSTGSTFGVILN
jgi:anti-sigma factor RsiW